MEKKQPCTKCGDTGKYRAGTANPCSPLPEEQTKLVPCPYCAGLKVIHTTGFRMGRQTDFVAAVKSMAEFSRISGLTMGYLRNYSAETGSAEQIEAAMSKPGTIFWRTLNRREDSYLEKDWK